MKFPSVFVTATAIVGAVLSAISFAYAPRPFALGVVVGALLSVANLWVLARIVPTVMAPGPEETATASERKFWSLVGAFKFLAMIVIVGLVMRTGTIDAMGLVLGTFALPAGLALATRL